MATSTSWQTCLGECADLIHLAPPVAQAESSLVEIVGAFAADPRPGVVFVIGPDDRLLGWVLERTLDTDLLVTVLPPDAWRAVGELHGRDVLRAALAPQQTARELMSPAPMAHADTTLKDAVVQMVRGSLRVLALVDDHQRLLGYVTLFDILAEFLKTPA